MTQRNFRRILWLAMLLALPVPMASIDTAFVPVGRIVMLVGLCVGAVVAEGFGPVINLLIVSMSVQAVAFAAFEWLVAHFAARLLTGPGRAVARRLTLAAVLVAVMLTMVVPIYRTPFSDTAMHNTLRGVYR